MTLTKIYKTLNGIYDKMLENNWDKGAYGYTITLFPAYEISPWKPIGVYKRF